MSKDQSGDVQKAINILRGQSLSPAAMLELAKRLKEQKAIGYARRLLARARVDEAIDDDPKLRLKIYQESALCTYKDPDLPVDMRLDRALEILRKVEDLSETKNQETLGLTGAIYKRKWEVDNQKQHLERALLYYERGYEQGPAWDQGYTAINAAFVLDLLAYQEIEEAKKANKSSETAEKRRADARRIREDIIRVVPGLIERPENKWLLDKWWYYSTIGEAFFGLGRYREAVEWMVDKKPATLNVPEWEYESTVRQLATLARLQRNDVASEAEFEKTEAWAALKKFLGNDVAAVRSAFTGKIGLGLSGGGFRASLFHIGVLARLAELDVLRRVEVLSCVSGGSIIGAHYYLEVRRLLQTKPDQEITREDYIEIVRRIEKDFLDGVQQNVRTRVAAELTTNLKMIFLPNYSRTLRAGELYESEIFSRIKDNEGEKERWLNDLYVRPAGEREDFTPKYHNWRREAKVPILILNTATLNTGHTWQFTASWMGEPPAGIDSEIDGNDRLRRMYYSEAPDNYRKIRFGYAVAASACVPGLFEPLALDNLFPDRVVRVVDGGVCDNQGIGGLLEQDCNVLLISDGSGQMESQKNPSSGLLGVPLRSNSILQSRVREAQYSDISARKRSALLRGFMFVHLKQDLDVDPVDWVDCMDPYDASDDARPARRKGPLTRYGIAKDIQQSLAAVRTDLDSFNELEAYALMTSAYRMTENEFAVSKCIEGFREPERSEPWRFLEVESAMKGEGKRYRYLKKLLGVSNSLAFKVWMLSAVLKTIALALALTVIIFVVWACIHWANVSIVPERISKTLTFGWIGMTIATAIVFVIAGYILGSLLALKIMGHKIKDLTVGGRNLKDVLLLVRWRDTLERILIGVVMSLVGWIAARIHLHFFDKMFLRYGSLDRLQKEDAT
jgi:predicted acylesterase/phospholipase RssA